MRDWLVETIDQIALGENLASTTLSCGQRFGLIAVDNAVEFMLIAYVEVYKRLVNKPGGITKKDWQEIKSKFPTLLGRVVFLEANLKPHEDEIYRYHDFRNGLYHSGVPASTTSERVTKYSKLARDVLRILFDIKFTTEEWNRILTQVATSLSREGTIKTIQREVTFDKNEDVVTFTTSSIPITTDAIALCLYGYSVKIGAPPSSALLTKSLALSGFPTRESVIANRLSDLRKWGWIRRDGLVLTAKGRKELAKKYFF